MIHPFYGCAFGSDPPFPCGDLFLAHAVHVDLGGGDAVSVAHAVAVVQALAVVAHAPSVLHHFLEAAERGKRDLQERNYLFDSKFN